MEISQTECSECGSIFVPSRTSNKYFCSKRCCNKRWQKDNKERISNYRKQKRANTSLLCRECGKPIKDRKGGKTLCSPECARKRRLGKGRAIRRTISDKFMEFKQKKKCSICGYNQFGGSLDFHHRDPSMKKRRITAAMWKAGTKKILEEIAKCDLLCKNCHYEKHFEERRNHVRKRTKTTTLSGDSVFFG